MAESNISSCASEILRKFENASVPNVTIIFPGDFSLGIQKGVLMQLTFFKSMFDDKIVTTTIDMSKQKEFSNKKAFMHIYEKLKERTPEFVRLDDNKKRTKLIEYSDQMDYVKLVNYVSDPKERYALMDDIKFSSLFWVNLVAMKFENITTFFTSKQLEDGYRCCFRAFCSIGIMGDSQEMKDLRIFFNQKDPLAIFNKIKPFE